MSKILYITASYKSAYIYDETIGSVSKLRESLIQKEALCYK